MYLGSSLANVTLLENFVSLSHYRSSSVPYPFTFGMMWAPNGARSDTGRPRLKIEVIYMIYISTSLNSRPVILKSDIPPADATANSIYFAHTAFPSVDEENSFDTQ